MRDLPTSLAHIIRQIVLTPADTILQKTSEDLADELKRQEAFICQSSIVKSFLDTLIDSVCSGTARVCIALCSWGCVYVNFVLGTYCIVVSGPCQLHLLPYRVAGSVRLVHELFFLFFFFASSCFFMCWRWSFGRSRVCLEDVHMPGVCSVLIRRFM